MIPIAPMSQDVEVLDGDPDTVGEPFVMRIRELPGGVIPPHRHPVDDHCRARHALFRRGRKIRLRGHEGVKGRQLRLYPEGKHDVRLHA